MTLKKEMLDTMLTLQEGMNSRVTDKWREEKFPWTDAIFTEATEAFNHTNWEWWKNSEAVPDVKQIKLEIVDIWHFILSELMCYNLPEPTEELKTSSDLAEPSSYFDLIQAIDKEIISQSPKDYTEINIEVVKLALKNLITAALQAPSYENRIIDILITFIVLINTMRMNWVEVYELYVSKNVLNQFRQNNGYKAGTYIKKWNGVEDNEYLSSIMATLDIDSKTYKEDLYSLLSNHYAEVKLNAK